jgi:hypothetical protein
MQVFWDEIQAVQTHCLALKMDALRSFETSITVYCSARRKTEEDSTLQQQHCENPKIPIAIRVGWKALYNFLIEVTKV